MQPKSYRIIIVIISVVFAGAIAALFLFPFGMVSFPKSENLYIIYYGNLVDESGGLSQQTEQILAANPALVIVPHSFPDGEPNLTPQVRQTFKDNDIKVLTYLWTNYGSRDLNEVKADIDTQISQSQSDGIFVDEVAEIQTEGEYSYYESIYQHVKRNHGEDIMVVMNPGHYKVSERIMLISDIVSLEEEWVYHANMPWKWKYPPSKFMGVSSNEYCVMCVDGSNAASKTIEAWDSGIGYHFATDRYVDLPTWFDSYALSIQEEKIEQPTPE